MPRLFYSNFDCEYDWATECAARNGRGSLANTTSAVASRQSAGLAPAWLALAEGQDFVVGDPRWGEQHFPDLVKRQSSIPRFVSGPAGVTGSVPIELVPWGWTEAIARMPVARAISATFPTPVTAALVNRREFRFAIENELGLAPRGSGVARTLDELNELLQDPALESSGWILKANFGMSGREALRGRGRSLTDSQSRWAARRVESMGAIIVEPRLDAIAEAGIQLEISRSGKIELLGVAEQIVVSGSWRGSRFDASGSAVAEWSDAVTVACDVGRRVHRAGYFGPLGLDAMRYRDASGQSRLRPLQDLNARFTMGRLTLGWRRLLSSGECGTWLHLDATACDGEWFERLAGMEETSAGRARGILTSPASGTTPLTSRVSVLVLAADDDARRLGEATLLPAAG